MTIVNEKKLDNIKKAISFALFEDRVYEGEKKQNGKDLMERNQEYIIQGLNEIFESHLSLNSKLEDLPWNDPTLSQINNLESFMEKLQKKYIVAYDEPCDDCGHYFSPGEDMYVTEDGNLCENCWRKEFPTDRSWDEYLIMTNSDEVVEPTSLKKFSDKEIAGIGAELCNNEDASAYYTQAVM